MIIDDKHRVQYHVIHGDAILQGWSVGWQIFDQLGSPPISLEVLEEITRRSLHYTYHSNPLNMDLWPDTKDYDQNSPGIIERVKDLDKRIYKSDIEKAFWINVTRVPICASYLAAIAKVKPAIILELGTGGDSAHSTGMFLYWLSQYSQDIVKLVSVDRHPLSHVWPRYREFAFWHFIQGDSITVMKKLINKEISALPSWYNLIFIDSSHTYPHTLKEIEQASFMTHAILLDDTTVEDVKKSLDEFLSMNKEWLRIDLAHGITLIEKHPFI